MKTRARHGENEINRDSKRLVQTREERRLDQESGIGISNLTEK